MPRNKQLNQRMRDQRRDAILAEALHLFASNGLAATKITDIAARAKMSQGLLYHYFETKEEIFVELIASAFDRMNAAALALEQLPLPPRAKIAKAISELLNRLAGNDDAARYFMLIAQVGVSTAVPEEAVAAFRKQSGVPYEVIARILRAGQRDGSIRKHDADEMAVVFWTMIKGLAMHRLTHGKKFKAPDPTILTNTFFSENDR